MSDETFMRRAIDLARPRVGFTGDNPAVGCVIVRDGQVVGEGATGFGGRPHAEEVALAQAGGAAAGAVAYVTLEPCGARSNGGTSCSNLLISHGISRVVMACADPSPFAAELGPRTLEAAAVALERGMLADEAADLYRNYRPV